MLFETSAKFIRVPGYNKTKFKLDFRHVYLQTNYNFFFTEPQRRFWYIKKKTYD